MTDLPDVVFGEFWLPGVRDRVVSGRLRRETHRMAVELDRFLTPALVEIQQSDEAAANGTVLGVPSEEPNEPLTIYGFLFESSQAITLCECYTSDRTVSLVDPSGTGRQTLRVIYALIGGHLPPNESFTSCMVRTALMDEWANLHGFESRIEFGVGLSISYEYPVCDPVRSEAGYSVDLTSEVTLQNPSPTGGSITRSTAVLVAGFSMGYREMDRAIVTPISVLLSLCTARPCLPIQLKVKVDDEAGWIEVVTERFPKLSAEEARPGSFLISLEHIGLSGVARWLDRVEVLGPVPSVVADSISASVSRLESNLLQLTTVAEGLHDRLYPDAERYDGDTVERVRNTVHEALVSDTDALRLSVRGLLGLLRVPSYSLKLETLIERASEAMPGVCGDQNRWRQSVGRVRVEFAHQKQGFVNEDEIRTYIGILQSIQWLLRGILILETAISSHDLSERVARNSDYTSFLARMRDFLPRVYGQGD